MKNIEESIKKLNREKEQLEREIKQANFKGYPEVKEINRKKYIYLRYKKYDALSSTYAGVYSEELFNNLKEMSSNMRQLNSRLRVIKTKLAKLGVDQGAINSKVILNLDFIRNNLNTIIYGQAVIEGVSATFLDTEEILEKGSSKNVNFNDTLTILNLKNAWKYVLDEDTVRRGINFNVLTNIAGFVNDRQISYPDQIRSTRVLIGGSTYTPPIPVKENVIMDINKIINVKNNKVIDKAINLLCYLCKAQVFSNGNKRTALIFANYYLALHGGGFISVSDKLDKEYKSKLVDFYESKNDDVKKFLRNKCYLPL